MAVTSTSHKALADVFDSEFSPEPDREQEPLECELARLKAMPLRKAVRQLGWRLVKAFTQEDPRAVVFWALVFAALMGSDGCTEMMSDFARIIERAQQRLS